MKTHFALVLLLALLWSPLVFSQAAPTPAPAPVVQPVPPPEPIGPNTTTFAAGGILVAAWEVFRRFVLPRISPEPQPQPPPQPPSPPPAPYQPGNPLLDLLKLILERLLMQPQPLAPLHTAAPPEPLPQEPPEWARELLARGARKV